MILLAYFKFEGILINCTPQPFYGHKTIYPILKLKLWWNNFILPHVKILLRRVNKSSSDKF